MAEVMEITDGNFEEKVLGSTIPFLLDLTAEWCGPCKAVAPLVQELARQYEGRVGFGAVNIDRNPQIPARFQVRSIPTLLLFRDGQVVGQLSGAYPKKRIAELIDRAL